MSLHIEQLFESQPVAANAPPVVIIPGLFGSTVNWRSFAKRLSQDHSVMVVDQRNHGRSPHYGSNTYFDLAEDLLALFDSLAYEHVILCGHSMGGKTAMLFSLLNPSRVAGLAILDIVPKEYPSSHAPYIEALLSLDLAGLQSRKEADELLKSDIPDVSTRMFLLQSLAGRQGAFYWRLNLPVLSQFMPQISGFPSGDVKNRRFDRPSLLVYGANSEYVEEDDILLTKSLFKELEVSAIEDAGHWLHIEQADAVLARLDKFVKKLKKND